MADTKQAWGTVAEQFSELGSRLKLHFKEAGEALPDDETVKKALEDLRDSLEHAFSAVGKTVKDPEVKEDVAHVATSLREALSATFAEVDEGFRSCFTRKGPPQADDAP